MTNISGSRFCTFCTILQIIEMMVCSMILPSLQTETFNILIFWTTPNVPFPATQSLRKVNLTELQTDSLSLLTPYQHQQSTTIIISNKIISTSSGFFFSICFAITLVILLFSIALHQNISWKQGSSQLQLSCWKQRLLNCRWSAWVYSVQCASMGQGHGKLSIVLLFWF